MTLPQSCEKKGPGHNGMSCLSPSIILTLNFITRSQAKIAELENVPRLVLAHALQGANPVVQC